MSASDAEEVAESAAYREAFEKEERALRNAVNGKPVKSSADEFTGKITKPEAAQEEIAHIEPKTPDGKIDKDIFVSRDNKAFREMGVFEDSNAMHEVPVVHMEPEMERAPKSIYEQKLPPETEFTGRIAESFHVPEERTKQVVTASGKVIETDTEEIVKKKLEKRKLDLAEKEEAENTVLQEIKQTEEKPKKPYVFPSMDLLARGKGPSVGQSDKEFRETAIKLQQTLRNFGVGVTVTNISCGPTVTRYELQPEQGVKVSKIQALADDIKLNLAATDIRIEAPIPGKAAVGIEVPNKVNSMVYLRELLESNELKKHPSKLAFAVGKDIGGQVIVADIAKMPHLLIAGQTGSGKSVGINTMIMSLIYRSSPEDVKLIMIDPKVVELSVYNGIPHLLIPVVTDPKKAAGALNWAVAEMMERYNKFAQSNVRDIKGYNAKVQSLVDAGDVPKDQIPSKLPQLVIIIDELADLMMVASNEVEDAICRLAQLARAAGIHLVIATQRPSVNVITGVIKANVPSRIGFSVASGVDSRTILDMNGAEKLLGNGDMLFYPSGYPKPLRVQGAFVSDAEVSRVTDFLKEQNDGGGYNAEVEMKLSQPTLGGTPSGGGNDRDPLFPDAAKFIIEKDKASIGMLQRVFKIGFNRAARIMDQLAEAGVVGEEEGTKPRKVLMSMEEFEAFLEAGY
ncbi:MAG: DNA translocase FtsK, partial [Lachnospiraceae bacterium]|nr:DNA translocase FtsK [Lachnospiraceae bacterium]